MTLELEALVANIDAAELRKLLTTNRLLEAQVNRAFRQAVVFGRVDLFSLLIENGGEIDSRHEHTGSPLLHSAVEHGRKESVLELIRLGAEKNAVDPSGASALHLAIDVASDAAEQSGQEPDWSMVELLLELGIDPSIRDHEGRTAKDWADLAGVESPLEGR